MAPQPPPLYYRQRTEAVECLLACAGLRWVAECNCLLPLDGAGSLIAEALSRRGLPACLSAADAHARAAAGGPLRVDAGTSPVSAEVIRMDADGPGLGAAPGAEPGSIGPPPQQQAAGVKEEEGEGEEAAPPSAGSGMGREPPAMLMGAAGASWASGSVSSASSLDSEVKPLLLPPGLPPSITPTAAVGGAAAVAALGGGLGAGVTWVVSREEGMAAVPSTGGVLPTVHFIRSAGGSGSSSSIGTPASMDPAALLRKAQAAVGAGGGGGGGTPMSSASSSTSSSGSSMSIAAVAGGARGPTLTGAGGSQDQRWTPQIGGGGGGGGNTSSSGSSLGFAAAKLLSGRYMLVPASSAAAAAASSAAFPGYGGGSAESSGVELRPKKPRVHWCVRWWRWMGWHAIDWTTGLFFPFPLTRRGTDAPSPPPRTH